MTRLLSVDPRSLRVFRIGLGLLVMADVLLRFPLSTVLLSPAGLLRTHPEEYFGLLSILNVEGAESFVLAAAFFAGLFVCLDRFSRVSAGLAWFLVASIQARNPWALDGGDDCFRWLLLWNFLVALEDGGGAAVGRARFSFAGSGLMLQPVLLYWASVLHKIQGNTWREGSAVSLALSQSLWERPLGSWLVEHSGLSVAANYSALVLEIVGPLLLLSPVRTRTCRWAGLFLLLLLQVGIAMVLRMNLFPWIMTVSVLPFVPGDVFSQLKAGAKQRSQPSDWVRRCSQALLIQAAVAAVNSVLGGRLLPAKVERLQTALGLDQSWAMYAPNPYRFDFGIEVTAKMPGPRSWRLDEGRLQHEFPPLRRVWTDYRGGMYLENLANPNWPEELEEFCIWLSKEIHTGTGEEPVALELVLLEWTRGSDGVQRTPLLSYRDAQPTSE